VTPEETAVAARHAVAAIEATLTELDAAGLRLPASTLRLQLGRDLDLHGVAAIVPLLAELGVDAAYLSPITQAAPGSTSGYDAIDHDAISAELGGEAGLAAVADALAANGVTALIDVVPNHAGGVPWHNPRWQDVLTWGRAAASAPWFDIDWEAPGADLYGRLLVAELGDTVEATIAAGQLPLALDGDAGGRRLVLRPYGDRVLPLSPPTWPLVLDPAAERLEGQSEAAALRRISEALGEPDPAAAERLLADLPAAHPLAEAALAAEVEAVNDTGPAGRARKLALLDAQPYRLDRWQRSFQDINYRRFFDIRDLAGLRQELPEVFEATHGRILAAALRLGQHRAGLRIDHPGGLADPAGYLAALQLHHLAAWAAEVVAGQPGGDRLDRAALTAEVARLWAEARTERPGSPLVRPLWVVIESVLSLEVGEDLPAGWPVHGEVGYGALNLLTHLQMDPEGAARIAGSVWPRVTGPRPGQRELAHASKRGVVDGVRLAGGATVPGPLRPDAELLTRRLLAIAAGDPEAKTFEAADLGEALREVAARLPVYRTYTGDHGELEPDQRILVEGAVTEAKAAAEPGAKAAIDWLGDVLTRSEGPPEAVAFRRRFEQFTAPLAAKGLEDRLLYVHHPNPAANEVGGDPGALGIAPAAWHAALERRLADWPGALTATSTHDTKRAADVRARLTVLTEVPDAWAAFLDGMLGRLEPMRADTPAGRAPSGNELYLLLATLVGTLPATDLDTGTAPVPAGYADRIAAYMTKALREGKETTSWVAQDVAWEAAMRQVVGALLADPACLAELRRFTAEHVAVPGMVNGLAQVVLKLAGPVPDVYQRELGWDHDLVDPDNRGPVDWAAVQATLDGFGPHLARDEQGSRRAAPGPGTAAFARELLADWPGGRVKLWVTMLGLHARNRHRRLHRHGAWVGGGPDGPAARTVAGARVLGEDAVLTVVPRLTAGLAGGRPPVGAAWGDQTLALPDELPAGAYANVFTGAHLKLAGGQVPLAELLADLPVAILERTGDGTR
jgi:(1->4)-alpha-D-glucan 1-alpha-D-glucosylmutase